MNTQRSTRNRDRGIFRAGFLFAAVFLCALVNRPAFSQSANDLILAVNALRAQNGLEAYTVDGGLNAAAQAHSEYQASIQQTTHNRADGSQIPARSENVCGGAGVSAAYCVDSMWTDELHLYTMIGLDSGTVGAGYALSANGAAYYTLLVNSRGADTGLNVPKTSPSAAQPQSSSQVAANQNAGNAEIDILAAPVQPGEFATSTAQPDGSIYHIVQANETLWTIAINYGTTIAQIQAMNNMSGEDTSVTAGQRILIVYGGTPVSDTLTPTVTPPPATNTPRPTSTITATLPPLDSPTPTITTTPTPGPIIQYISFFDEPEARYLGFALVILCGVGLLFTWIFGFRREE